MNKSLQKRLLQHVPLLVSAAILGIYSLDSELIKGVVSPRFQMTFIVQLVPLALILALVQVGIWLSMAAGRIGWRRTITGAAGILVVIACVRHIVGWVGTRGVERDVVVASHTLYRGAVDGFMFAVSPDERWLIYARESGEMRDGIEELPEIVVRDLVSGEDRVVKFDGVRKGPYFTVAEEILMVLDEPHWMETSARFQFRHDSWIEIDLESSRARMLSPRDVTPIRPSVDEMRKYLARYTRRGRFDASVAWDGSTVGKYIYSAVAIQTPWRKIGVIERRAVDGEWERVTARRELFANWGVHQPAVSPDGRFVAYTGRRDKLSTLFLQLLIPVLGFGSTYRDYLFVYDTQTGRDYKLGEVDGVESPQWSGDSRHFYYAELNPWNERQIYSIHFDVGSSEPIDGRIAWEPPGKKRNPSRNLMVVETPGKELAPSQDLYAGWKTVSVRGVSFRYPAKELTFSEEDGVVRLEHAVDFTHRNPCAEGRELHRLTDFALTLEVVDKPYDALIPNGAQRGRLRPGYGFNALTRSFWVAEGDAGCEVEWWYCPIEDRKTLVVSRPRVWAPSSDDPLHAAYLGLDGLIDRKRANEIFHLVANSIKADER